MTRWQVKVWGDFPILSVMNQEPLRELQGQRRVYRWRWLAVLYAWRVNTCGFTLVFAEVLPLDWPDGTRKHSWLWLRRAGVVLAAPVLPFLIVAFYALVGLLFTVALLVGPGDQTRWAAFCEAWGIVLQGICTDMGMAEAALRKIWHQQPWAWHGFEE